MSSIGRTDLIERVRRIATASGFSSGSQVSSWKARKISSIGAALAVLEAPAGERLGHRVDVVDDALGVGGDDAVADALQRDLRALLLAEQRLLVELALGDVELDADQAQQPALVVDLAPWRG